MAHMDHSMPGMEMTMSDSTLPSPHAGSGTGWQPAETPAHIWMTRRGGWDLMAHGVVFAGFTHTGGPRGAGKAESMNWAMLMEQHQLGRGTLLFREMFSADSLTSPHPGYPQLFQTGETYKGQPLLDHQHPHDVFGELAAYYSVPLSQRWEWSAYAALSGEPALGPVAFMHRASAAELPAAPLGHHLQDSTHISFGVLTGGLRYDRVKLELSAFNGREPDEKRYNFDFAPLDSWSTRISVAPGKRWTAQYSYGHLVHPEALELGDERRQSASLEYARKWRDGYWASTAVWGRKHKQFTGRNTNSYLLESTVNLRARNYAFTRLELVDKDELFPGKDDNYRIAAFTFGGVRDLVHNRTGQIGLGADLTFYHKPSALDPTYGHNPVTVQLFLRLRPALGEHMHH